MKPEENSRIRAWKTLQWQLTLFVFAIILLSCLLTLLIRLLFQLLLVGTPLFNALSLNPILFTTVLWNMPSTAWNI